MDICLTKPLSTEINLTQSNKSKASLQKHKWVHYFSTATVDSSVLYFSKVASL